MALQMLPVRVGVRFLRLAHPGVQVPGGTRRQSTSDTLPTPQTASQSAIGLSPIVQSIGQPRLGVLPSLQKQIVSDSTGAVVVVVVGVSVVVVVGVSVVVVVGVSVVVVVGVSVVVVVGVGVVVCVWQVPLRQTRLPQHCVSLVQCFPARLQPGGSAEASPPMPSDASV